MSRLANFVKNNFAGMLIFGDIHADYRSFCLAYEYAIANNYFFMSLGDLVDRGRQPYETVFHMHSVIQKKAGGFVTGNHDDKFHRHHKGNKVSFSVDAKRTMSDVGEERWSEFLQMYSAIIDCPDHSAVFHTFDDLILVHAASHPSMWDSTVKFGNEARSRALYGEVNGERDSMGYPVRLYNWVDEIPMGKTVIVGHDRTPIHNVPMSEPMVRSNANGGKAIFIDTGCGKGGFLSGMVVKIDKSAFKFDSFVEFK